MFPDDEEQRDGEEKEGGEKGDGALGDWSEGDAEAATIFRRKEDEINGGCPFFRKMLAKGWRIYGLDWNKVKPLSNYCPRDSERTFNK